LHPPVAQGSYVAAVNQSGDMPALIVRVDLATKAVTVRPVAADTPPGKSLELWYIAAGQSPKSMGVVEKGRGERMSMPNDMPLKDTIFAVTVEVPGGSPTGAPMGPVVYKGALIAE
jgi:anti-sigma-K factor RskA